MKVKKNTTTWRFFGERENTAQRVLVDFVSFQNPPPECTAVFSIYFFYCAYYAQEDRATLLHFAKSCGDHQTQRCFAVFSQFF